MLTPLTPYSGRYYPAYIPRSRSVMHYNVRPRFYRGGLQVPTAAGEIDVQPGNGNGSGAGGAAALSAGIIVAALAIGVAVNYQVGKAMSPDKRSERKWAWGAGIGGTIFPPTILGMAIYKNYFR